MWSRLALAAGLVAVIAVPSAAQNSKVYSRALPPDQAALNRLNLRTEWMLYLPINGHKDTIALVQTLGDQVFVQTRSSLLIAVDARTGRVQWSTPLGTEVLANVYPVAANSRFVYAVNLTKLFAFYRYTGVAEFVTDLGTNPTTGLTADSSGLYTVLSNRPGASGAARLAAYNLPHPIAIVDPAQVAAAKAGDHEGKLANPVDQLTVRYPAPGARRPSTPDQDFTEPARASLGEVPVGGLSGSRTPSLAVAQRVTPPYKADVGEPVRALNILQSLRRPYHLRDESLEYNQRTPSINSIPPSVAAALALSNLTPRGIEPTVRWEYGTTAGVNFPLIQTPRRLWAASSDRKFLALSKVDRQIEVAAALPAPISATPAQAGTIGYVPLANGTLQAVDLSSGDREGGWRLLWRANIGGLLNHTPVVTADAVYAAGDNSGITRIDRASGVVSWQTDRGIDRVVAVNKDFLYAQDRQGRVYVFDAVRANGGPGRAVPLSSIDLSAFSVPVVNTATDRAYFAADNGLLICLRDASAKYAAAVPMAPEIPVDPLPKGGIAGGKANMPPMKEEAPPKMNE